MREERHSTTSEKITAAAAVATAVAATKTAVETTKARQEMENMNRAMQIAADRHERIQLAMASEQVENNFRNTVLATLPLLKTKKDKVQFLTEQFVPKLQNTEEAFIFSPVQWVKLSDKKNNTIATFLEGDAGKEVKKFLSNGKDLQGQKDDLELAQINLEILVNTQKWGLTDFLWICLEVAFCYFLHSHPTGFLKKVLEQFV